MTFPVPAHEKPSLALAVSERYSCHNFTSPLTLSDWSALSYLAGKISLPGIRITLLRVSESLFTGTFLSLGRVAGCTTVAVLSGSMTGSNQMLAGFCGELFVLHVTRLGLKSCWMTSGFQKKRLLSYLKTDEQIFALIALGNGSAATETRKRKDLRKLCTEDPAAWPEPCFRAASMVCLAPSSGNQQPFLMGYEPGRFWLDSSDKTRIDLGVALCHAELAFSSEHDWSFSEKKTEPMASCLFRTTCVLA